MKEQLASVVLQMYKAGVRCSEAMREFQKAFILTVLKDQRGNQSKAAEKLGMHRNTLRRTIRELEIDIGPTRVTGRRRSPRSEFPISRRRVSYSRAAVPARPLLIRLIIRQRLSMPFPSAAALVRTYLQVPFPQSLRIGLPAVEHLL
jgi:Fis family transcriptional regulator